jgi:hypothetical protein
MSATSFGQVFDELVSGAGGFQGGVNRISEPGFYDLPASEYHSDPCKTPSLSSSLAVDLVKRSPAHAKLRHPRLTPRTEGEEETKEMSFGSVVHELLLGKGGGFAVWERETWKGKAAAAFYSEAVNSGKTPIKRADFKRAEMCCSSARSQLASMKLGYVLEEGQSEQVAVWKEGSQYCRAMYDKWHPARNEIWDIKTTGKGAHPDQIAKIIPQMSYDLRSEFYLMGAEKLTGIPNRKGGLGFCFLFVEVEPPFSVVPCYMEEAFTRRGRRLAQQAVDTWIRCMEGDTWPGYVNGVTEIMAPGWVAYEEEGDDEITLTGEIIR